MSARLYAFTCGSVTVPQGFLLEGRKGFITVPVPDFWKAVPQAPVRLG